MKKASFVNSSATAYGYYIETSVLIVRKKNGEMPKRKRTPSEKAVELQELVASKKATKPKKKRVEPEEKSKVNTWSDAASNKVKAKISAET